MKISINTETEEISELRAAIAIIEDVIKRRENPEPEEETEDITEESYETETSQQEIPELQPEEEIPKPQPEVDMSALSKSNYGQAMENRNFGSLFKQNNKKIIKEIIIDLSKQNPNQPIQMSDIILRSSRKNIREEETRNLVDELKESGEI